MSSRVPDPVSVTKDIKDAVIRYIDSAYSLRDEQLAKSAAQSPGVGGAAPSGRVPGARAALRRDSERTGGLQCRWPH